MDFRERASFQVIVGEEIDTSEGELIGLFLEAAVPIGMTAIETAEHIHAQGGLVYLQHPFYRLTGGRLQPAAREQLRARGLLDIVEARNGGPWAGSANARALQWARACDLPHAASSDAHEPAAIGSCLSVVAAGRVDAASLPGLLRTATVIDRRSPAPVAVARHVASRARSELEIRLGARAAENALTYAAAAGRRAQRTAKAPPARMTTRPATHISTRWPSRWPVGSMRIVSIQSRPSE